MKNIKQVISTNFAKRLATVFSCMLLISILQGCSNYDPEKGNHYKDTEDTTKKKDSVQPSKELNPEDKLTGPKKQ